MSQARRLRGRAALQVAIALTGVFGLAEARLRAQPLDGFPPVVGASEVFVADERSGLGLRGFDPVSYFLAPAPLPGREAVELIWSGVGWRFASAANREAFARDPDIYAPRIGGHDASAAADGRLVAADPTVFAIAGDRLYVFRNERSRARFLADRSLAGRAEARWPELQRGLVRG
jgi:hypothetical protein